MSSQQIKDTIMDWIGPTAISATPPLEEFIALGSDAIPAVIDIFQNPQSLRVVREYGSDVYLPVLVRLLNHYALAGNTSAGHTLFEIANSRIPTWGKYASETFSLAHELAQKTVDQTKTGQMVPDSGEACGQCGRSPISFARKAALCVMRRDQNVVHVTDVRPFFVGFCATCWDRLVRSSLRELRTAVWLGPIGGVVVSLAWYFWVRQFDWKGAILMGALFGGICAGAYIGVGHDIRRAVRKGRFDEIPKIERLLTQFIVTEATKAKKGWLGNWESILDIGFYEGDRFCWKFRALPTSLYVWEDCVDGVDDTGLTWSQWATKHAESGRVSGDTDIKTIVLVLRDVDSARHLATWRSAARVSNSIGSPKLLRFEDGAGLLYRCPCSGEDLVSALFAGRYGRDVMITGGVVFRATESEIAGITRALRIEEGVRMGDCFLWGHQRPGGVVAPSKVMDDDHRGTSEGSSVPHIVEFDNTSSTDNLITNDAGSTVTVVVHEEMAESFPVRLEPGAAKRVPGNVRTNVYAGRDYSYNDPPEFALGEGENWNVVQEGAKLVMRKSPGQPGPSPSA